jgi:hypothetical protein
MTPPKLFVSYSWANPDHEAWVLKIATELCEFGVDVILDKWYLKEGHDANAFMEKMVTDPEIKKVILICEKTYAEKADKRSGGVGTESQIISAEIYAKQDQDKFVAILKERDEEGRPYLPAYYRSRIFIDLSDSSNYSENYDKLLRWIFDKPLYEKPPIGEKPAFLNDSMIVSLATASQFRRAIDAIRNRRDNAGAFVTEYFELLASEIEKLRLDSNADPFDDAVVKSIEDFLPYRNEAIEMFIALSLYHDSYETRVTLHRFLEKLIPYLDRPPAITNWGSWDFDNFRFIVHELFLYAIACFIKYERFESAAYLMATDFFVPGQSEYGRDEMISYDVFCQQMDSLDHRKSRLKLNRTSLRADMLQQRCIGIGLDFRHVMQADFILFLRDHLNRPGTFWHWWPETLLYLGRYPGVFEIFARSSSRAYFEKVKVSLGIESKENLQQLLNMFESDPRILPRWQYETLNPRKLMAFDKIETKP